MATKAENGILQQIRHKIIAKDLLVLAIAIASLVVSASLLFESSNNWVFWLYDDTENLSIAYNFFHGHGFVSDMLDKEANSRANNISTLATHDQISTPLYSKPPMYLLLLGAWQTITNATYVNWYFWGSIFNLLLAVSIIPIYYIFARKYFTFEVSAISTIAIALMPVLVWHAVRLRSEVLAFIFVILSLYFAARLTLRNIVLMGLFTGLAHLTHPTGMLVGAALFIYLLSKAKFRSAAIFVATWLSLILPWMARNYVVFGDATQGLAIPLPKSFLAAAGLVINKSGGFTESSLSIAYIPPFQTLVGMLNEFTQLHGMQFFILLLACGVAAYISFGWMKKILHSKKNAVVFSIITAFYFSLGMWVSSLTDRTSAFELQILFLFVLPLIFYLYIRFSRNGRNILESTPSNIYPILGILGVLTFVFYIFYAQVDNRTVPEVRFLAYPLSLLIPLSVIGMRKLLNIFYPSTTYMSGRIVIALTSAGIVIVLSIFQVYTSIPIVNAYQTKFGEQGYQTGMDQWINENISLDAKTASDLPHVVLLRTGHESVNFYIDYKDNIQYERWIIKKFDIDYLIFYFPKSNISPGLQKLDLGDIHLEKVYESKAGGWIYKVEEGSPLAPNLSIKPPNNHS